MCPFCIATAADNCGIRYRDWRRDRVWMKRNKRKLLPQKEAEEIQHDDDSNRGSDAEDGIAR
jgi:hypothetical protein